MPSVRMHVCACVRTRCACVRACVHVCMHARVRVHVWVCLLWPHVLG